MTSIRSHLAIRLLGGFVVMLGLASCLVGSIMHKILESDFDSRLFSRAQAAMLATTHHGDRIETDWPGVPAHGTVTSTVQIFDAAGHPLLHDDKTFAAPPFPVTDRPAYKDMTLPGGRHLRVVSQAFLPHVDEDDEDHPAPTTGPIRCVVVVGEDRAPLDHVMAKLAAVLAVAVGLTSVTSLGIVLLALNRGLRPLVALGTDVARTDVASLGQRIDIEPLPEELQPIAEKLNDFFARLEASFARERRFSADVSHELRTPVAELRSLAEVMLRQPDLAEKTRLAFNDVLSSALQMETIVVTLLEMVRSEQASDSSLVETIDLRQAIDQTLARYSASARGKRLEISVRLPETITLRTDPRLLGIVLNNLISNAVEYTPEKGRIELSYASSDSAGSLFIQNTTRDLKPEDLPHLFERFWRKNEARTGSGHLGLGLSLAQLLCQRLGMQLSATVPAAECVRFQLSIPR